jgi:hypothetical protein
MPFLQSIDRTGKKYLDVNHKRHFAIPPEIQKALMAAVLPTRRLRGSVDRRSLGRVSHCLSGHPIRDRLDRRIISEWRVTRPQWIVTRRVNLSVRTRQIAEQPTSFAQEEILAPLGLTKGELIYFAKKDF